MQAVIFLAAVRLSGRFRLFSSFLRQIGFFIHFAVFRSSFVISNLSRNLRIIKDTSKKLHSGYKAPQGSASTQPKAY